MKSELISSTKWLLFTVLFTRIGSSVFSAFIEVHSDKGERLSPVTPLQITGDHEFYKKFVDYPWDPLSLLLQIRDFEGLLIWLKGDYYPGPLFPWLLKVTGYESGSPYYLFALFVALGIASCALWIMYLRKLEATLIEMTAVVCYPLLIYQTLVVSTDLPFCFFVGVFYYVLSKNEKVSWKTLFIAFASLLLCTLTRPNALPLLPVLGYFLWRHRTVLTPNAFYVVTFALLSIVVIATVYYLPYFLAFNRASSGTKITYWGIPQSEYLHGIFYGIPSPFNLAFSWVILTVSKVFYLAGLRPSYSGVAVHLVILRAAGGVLVLPGMLQLIARGSRFDKIFLLLFIAPVLIGASQERYLLPLAPILIFYGMQFWKNLFISALRRR